LSSSLSSHIKLLPFDNGRLANLCGKEDEHLRQIEGHLGVEIFNRGNHFQIQGDRGAVGAAYKLITLLYQETSKEKCLTPAKIHLFLLRKELKNAVNHFEHAPIARTTSKTSVEISTKKGQVKANGGNQAQYLQRIQTHDINFGIGPAGTGKTYLAVACAVHALEQEKVNRLVLVRPAVEAGERLGFLPGDMAQKVAPYLRPLYDALFEMMGFDHVAQLIERDVIEVAPLAYMRGRTLNDAFIILDEAQNTTVEQMKMFLTRMGFGSKVVVTGDITQIDLPRGTESGLIQIMKILNGINEISFTHFSAKDVVRHTLVQRIVEAYEQHKTKHQGITDG